ncbi:MAG: hypothetical protein IKA86_01440 [Paraprevotella sp.]|nr:hypothetical protein [Paraprevotella sp.]
MMNNENRNGVGTIESLCSFLMLIIITLIILTFPLSWVCASFGMDVNSLMTGEGIRYFFANIPNAFCTSTLAYVLTAITCIGAIKRSGIEEHFEYFIRRSKNNKPSFRRQQAFTVSLSIFCVYIILLLIMTIGSNGILLNIHGKIYPSEQLSGIIMSIPIAITIISTIYGFMSHYLKGWFNAFSTLYWGIKKYSEWIVLTILTTIFHYLIIYVVG